MGKAMGAGEQDAATSDTEAEILEGGIRALQGNELSDEGERVRRVNGRYAHLAQTASASVKIIAENLGNWHNVENVSPARSECV
jgi:hypothetical protein